MTNRQLDVLILGGGIGGLSTALALGRAGHRVRLTEQAHTFSEVGAGLQLGPNAIRSLDRLGVWSALQEVAVTPRAGLIMDAVTGKRLTRVDFGAPFVDRYGYPYVVAHRHDLLEILLAACQSLPNVLLETDRHVESVEESAEGAVVRYADGTVLTSTLVVGADGVRSRTRLLHDDSPPNVTGHVAFRGTLPIEKVNVDIDPRDMVLWIGPGLHLIQYPVRSGELYNQVAVIESSWHAAGREDWGSPEELNEAFSQTCDFVRESLEIFSDNRPWPIFDRDPIESWSTEHTVLLGDAAHAMRQYLAQGACQALEDALVLTQELGRHSHRADAFAAYEARRVERTAACQLIARPWGDLWHTRDQTLQFLRNKVFALRADTDYTEFDWLYQDHVGANDEDVTA